MLSCRCRMLYVVLDCCSLSWCLSSVLVPEFTDQPSQLQGYSIHTRLSKGPRGFGFNIVGGTRPREFLQVYSVTPAGPPALNTGTCCKRCCLISLKLYRKGLMGEFWLVFCNFLTKVFLLLLLGNVVKLYQHEVSLCAGNVAWLFATIPRSVHAGVDLWVLQDRGKGLNTRSAPRLRDWLVHRSLFFSGNLMSYD